MNQENLPQIQKPNNAKNIIERLREDYVVIGRTHIKPWQAWLVLGLAAGTAAGVILVANRSGEVEKGRAASQQITSTSSLAVYHTSPRVVDPSFVPNFGVFEITFVQPIDYGVKENFFDVDIDVTVTSPSGKQFTVGGFYYDTLQGPQSFWKARIAPSEVGTWKYDYTFIHTPSGYQTSGSGSFTSISSIHPGFLRKSTQNPYRWVFDNGSPFHPFGLNDCIQLNDHKNFDGGDRVGAFLGPSGDDYYFEAYEDAGFNMFRFSSDNCSPKLASPPFSAPYDIRGLQRFDALMETLQKRDFRIWYGIFGYSIPPNLKNLVPGYLLRENPTPEELRFIEYSVNRWGAYTDIWELQNETFASDAWVNASAKFLRSKDPYQHPITTSWQKSRLPVTELHAPHIYTSDPSQLADLILAKLALDWKKFGKPVIAGEEGDSSLPIPLPGVAGLWDPQSAPRTRVKSWTALFNEVSLLYWNNSWAANGGLYLGREERQFSHILQWFSNLVLTTDLKMLRVSTAHPTLTRAHVLSSSQGVAFYLNRFAYPEGKDIDIGENVTASLPQAGQGLWLDPFTGKNLGTVNVTAGQVELTSPPFQNDIAFFSIPAGTKTPPLAFVSLQNPQADGDLDNDGKQDQAPWLMPFGSSPLTLTFDATSSFDFDGGQLLFQWIFGDGVEAQGAIATHTYQDGIYFTTLVVTDDEGEKAKQSFLVRVTADTNPQGNDPPVLIPLRDVTVREGEVAIISPFANDSELHQSGCSEPGLCYIDDTLTYSAANLPLGAIFAKVGNTVAPTFWWVPDFTQSGTYQVTFTVTDQNGVSAPPQTVTITVLDAPLF